MKTRINSTRSLGKRWKADSHGITKWNYLDKNCPVQWFRIYIEKGIDALNSFHYQPKQSYLDEDQIDRVCEWVEAENPSATKEIAGFIFEKFGVRYRTESVRKMLKKRGFKFMEPKIVPGNPPTVEERKEFIDSTVRDKFLTRYFQI